MRQPVIVAGTSTTAFVARSGAPAEELAARALANAAADAGIDLRAVGLFVFGSRFEHPSIGQRTLALLGGSPSTVVNTENACASGSVGVEIATAYLLAGIVDVAVVVGVEQPSTLPPGPLPLPPADDLGRAGISHPVRYALDAAAYCAATGTPTEALAAVTVKNRGHASRNAAARFTTPVTLEEVLDSPMVAEPLTRLQCCANADGAAAVVLVTSDRAARLDAAQVCLRSIATGSGVRNDRVPETPLTTRVARRALEEAGMAPDDVDVAEVYDAFTINEVLATEHLGFASPGTAAGRIAAGDFRLGGRGLVTNPGGGLLGRGHPLGATGIAQLVEITDQLRGRCGNRQVDGARVGLVHTLGGNLRDIEANAGAVMVLQS